MGVAPPGQIGGGGGGVPPIESINNLLPLPFLSETLLHEGNFPNKRSLVFVNCHIECRLNKNQLCSTRDRPSVAPSVCLRTQGALEKGTTQSPLHWDSSSVAKGTPRYGEMAWADISFPHRAMERGGWVGGDLFNYSLVQESFGGGILWQGVSL